MTDVPIPADVLERAREVMRASWWEYSRDEATEVVARALMEERERAARMCEAWTKPDALRLAAGEMTAQEIRTALAVAHGLAAAIRGGQDA